MIGREDFAKIRRLPLIGHLLHAYYFHIYIFLSAYISRSSFSARWSGHARRLMAWFRFGLCLAFWQFDCALELICFYFAEIFASLSFRCHFIYTRPATAFIALPSKILLMIDGALYFATCIYRTPLRALSGRFLYFHRLLLRRRYFASSLQAIHARHIFACTRHKLPAAAPRHHAAPLIWCLIFIDSHYLAALDFSDIVYGHYAAVARLSRPAFILIFTEPGIIMLYYDDIWYRH